MSAVKLGVTPDVGRMTPFQCYVDSAAVELLKGAPPLLNIMQMELKL